MRVAMFIGISLLIGCAGVSTIGYDIGGGKHRVQRTISDPHAFAPTAQRSWLEVCDAAKVVVAEGRHGPFIEYQYTNCKQEGEVQFATATGYVSGLLGPVVQAGAIVGGAALIGNGLSRSGDTVSQSGATQSQSQAQRGGFRPPGHDR